MKLRSFIYYHPVVYRRILIVGMLSAAASGMFSLESQFGFPKSTTVGDVRPSTSVSAVKPAKASQLAALTTLPGKDGSQPAPEQVTPNTKARAAVAIAVRPALVVSGDTRALGRSLNAGKFGDAEWTPLEKLWTKESNWNPSARNRSSGACGIPQALPCSKIPDMSPQGQITWGLNYIAARYGTPSRAWQHSRMYGWY